MPIRPAPRSSYRWVWHATVALVLLLNSEVAHVGQLHIKKIELGELIQRSTHIVIAVPDDPPVLEEHIVIKARGKKPPPYVRLVHRFRVRESHRGDFTPGTVIAVAPADDALQERLHRDYHTKGQSRHVVVNRYEQQATFAADEPRILFLNNHGARLAYAVEGGAEGHALRGEVDPREALVDQALRAHGYFGVYGDLRAGLKVLRDTCEVQFTNDTDGVRVSIVPRDRHGRRAEGHEYEFVVTLTGTIEGFMAGE